MKLLMTMIAALALLAFSTVGLAQGRSATAQLKNADGETVATATFTEAAEGVVIEVRTEGLEPGLHGIHIHETGQCDPPDFKSAGGHFNPEGAMHGLENPEGPHAGDLPNLEVSDDGTASYRATTDRVTLGEGGSSLFDSDGSALVIHADEDDQQTDPSGESGDRIACGAIVSAGMPDTGGGGTSEDGSLPMGAVAVFGAVALGAGLIMRRLATC